MIGVAFALAMQAVAAAPSALNGTISPPMLLEADDALWVERPTSEAQSSHYPMKAAVAETAGAVLLDCVIAASGSLEACTIVHETPGRFGFAKGALAIAKSYRLAVNAPDGRTTPGSHIRVPFVFRPPPAAVLDAVRMKHERFKGATVVLDCRWRKSQLENCIPVRDGSDSYSASTQLIAELAGQTVAFKAWNGARIELSFIFD